MAKAPDGSPVMAPVMSVEFEPERYSIDLSQMAEELEKFHLALGYGPAPE